jgi:hypothetical protein
VKYFGKETYMFDVVGDNSHEEEVDLYALVNRVNNASDDDSYEKLTKLKAELLTTATRLRAQERGNVKSALAELEQKINPPTSTNERVGWHSSSWE